MCSDKSVNFCVFLRAHGLFQQVLNDLTRCSVNNFNIEDAEERKLSILLVQIISFLLHDPNNISYVTEDCFNQLHRTISLNPILEEVDGVTLKVLGTKKINTGLSLERALVMSLSAISNIVSSRQGVIMFNKSDISSTLEKLAPCLLSQLDASKSSEEDELLASCMAHCVRLLEASGVYQKYSNCEDSVAWNTLLPSLIRTMRCLIEHPRQPLCKLKDNHPIVDCILASLKFLVNITNFNKDVCGRVAIEGGIQATIEIITSNSLASDDGVGHFDVLNMCLGVLINITEKELTYRELVTKQQVGGQPFMNYLLTSFDDMCNSQKQKPASREVEGNIISSYLAILIACMVRDHKENQTQVFESKLAGFDQVINTLSEFVIFQSSARLLTESMRDNIRDMISELKSIPKPSCELDNTKPDET
ncbi:hypothetical protein AKO1_011700, partial [Acrasis kona]